MACRCLGRSTDRSSGRRDLSFLKESLLPLLSDYVRCLHGSPAEHNRPGPLTSWIRFDPCDGTEGGKTPYGSARGDVSPIPEKGAQIHVLLKYITTPCTRTGIPLRSIPAGDGRR